jgi:hypothetical protein
MTAPVSSSLRHLSGAVGRLAAAGHGGAALLIIAKYGGTRFYVPRKPGGELEELIGRKALEKLIEICGDNLGCWHRAPAKSRLADLKKTLILAELEKGRGSSEIARDLGTSDSYVCEVRRNVGAGIFVAPPKKAGGTLDLFDDYLAALPAAE